MENFIEYVQGKFDNAVENGSSYDIEYRRGYLDCAKTIKKKFFNND